jgi:hypothetical protein
MSKDFLDNRGRLDALITEKQECLTNMVAASDPPPDKKQIIGSFARVTELSRTMIAELIDCIYVGHRDPETGEREIEIRWSF